MKEPMIHSAIALVLHLILLAILMTVFKLNIYGVLYSNIFFGLIMCILNAISIKKYLRYRQELVRTFIIPLVSSGIMGLAAYGVYNLCHLAVGNAISCLAAILVAIVVYGVVLIKLRGITERELYAIPKGAILVGVLKNADCCKRKPIQRAAILHDLCTVGKAAMTNILPVLSVLGVEACPVPTMVLSTHTGGYGKPAIYPLSGFAGDCGKHLKSQGFSFDAVFVGYLGNEKNVREAYAFLEDFSGGPVLFDPIMADHGKFYSNFDESYNELLKGLIPRCTLMTPNYTESCLLTGEAYEESCSKEKFLTYYSKS
ncbi:MAG: polysaccharide biosynthesis C-terminal domain-containing protein [Blautia sp.]